MCLNPDKLYEEDQEFLDEVKAALGLRSRAMALRWILKGHKKLIKEEMREAKLK